MRNALALLWRSKRKLILAGILGLVIVLTEVAGYVFTRQAAAASTLNPFDPARFGLPGYIGSYKLLAVFTSDNLACMGKSEIRLGLQATAPDVGAFLATGNPTSSNLAAIQKDLEQHGKNVEIEIDGPGITIETIISESAKWNKGMKEYGCEQTGGPAPIQQNTGVP
jgi:hypothetical protein